MPSPTTTATPPPSSVDTMDELVKELGPAIIPFRQGDIVEVEVIGVSKQRILVNVQDLALGFIPQREFSLDGSHLELGQKLLAYILIPENQDGYVVLSLKRADRERLWRTIAEQSGAGTVIPVKVSDANKGGLVIDYGGIEGFLPISQLTSGNYAKVASTAGNFSDNLRQFVGKTIRVKIISFDERNRKLIFSEKAAGSEETVARLKELTVGAKLEGKITGITDFGLFVDVGGVEGLVHISEVSWERVDDLRSSYKPGEAVMVQVINVDDTRVSLSMKRLLPDPWQEAIGRYQIGQRADGK
ncbi:S1 RNA-binding domain-containing protein, partial [Candidatus Berkelbacteria bacterium]|nr:S1 RNA-binding domain-containing protein [Candidatus Berkelbacteria bacterium]